MATVSAIMFNMLDALKHIGSSLLEETSLWWFLAPVFLLWIMIELYFGKYKTEKLGWNTSLGNGVTLIWISAESMRFLFQTKPDDLWSRFTIICVIIFYAILVVYFSFTHKISPKATFRLASPSPIYFLSTITILWGHGVLIITPWVFADLVVLYLIISGTFAIVRKLMPQALKDLGMGDEMPPVDLAGKRKEPEHLDLDKELKNL